MTLVLTGPGGGVWQLDPSDALITVTPEDTDISAAARIESTTHAFTAWATTRLPWRDYATVTGDEQTAAKFLDVLNLV